MPMDDGDSRGAWRPKLSPALRSELRKAEPKLRESTDDPDAAVSDVTLLRRAIRRGMRKRS